MPTLVPSAEEKHRLLMEARKVVVDAVQAARRVCEKCGIEGPPEDLTISTFAFDGWLERRALEFLDDAVEEEKREEDPL